MITIKRRFSPPRHKGHEESRFREYAPIPTEIEPLGNKVFNSALKVHKTLGPGLLESVYEICLAHELEKFGLEVERQVALPIIYDGITLNAGLRLICGLREN